MRHSILPALLYSYFTSTLAAETHQQRCTITSPSNGGYYDLNTITVQAPKDHKTDDRTESWHARGYDYGANFTLNFCAPVIESITEVVGVDEGLWGNVSAYYTKNGDIYSIGSVGLT